MASNSSLPPSTSDTSSVMDTLDFFMYVGQLKTSKRTGWTHHNVHHVESVSDHMYRMAIMTMLLNNNNDNKLDTTRCMKMALVHDLAECITGDITPYCGVSEEEKFRREKEAMVKLTGLVPNKVIADEMMSLWEEYAQRQSAEAKAVKDLDRFEMILQAYEYEKSERRCGDLEKFFTGTEGKFVRDDVKGWVDELYKRRTELKNNQDQQKKTDETQYLDCT